MARVVHEPALALDRLLQAFEHGVQRLGQPSQLVAGSGDREAAPWIARRDRSRLSAHRLDGAERPADEEPRHADGQHERERATHRERRGEPAQGLPLVVERCTDHEDPPLRDGDGEHPRRDDLALDRHGVAFGQGRGDVGRLHERGSPAMLPEDSISEPSGSISCANASSG